MSMRACSRIVLASSRQFLGKHLPRRIGERSLYLKQEKRASTKEELGLFVFGLGALSTAIVLAVKEGAFSINMTPAELAKMKEKEEGGSE